MNKEHSSGDLIVRQTLSNDVSALAALLNTIIRIGGTTAYESPLSSAQFAEYFMKRDDSISCFTALSADGTLVGFQALSHNLDLPEGWGDIATFASIQPKIPGVGSALFEASVAFARSIGLEHINATIRADNIGGLAYYEKMGFQTYKTIPKVPLLSGELVDRIAKRFKL